MLCKGREVSMKILVTGANGYLGRGIVSNLLNIGVDVIATDFVDTNIDPRAKIITCDLFNLDSPYESLGAPDVLLHLAWRDGFIHNSDSHIDDLPRHYHFINKMMETGVKRVCVMGSMHEIGFYEGAIKEVVAKILEANPQSIADYKAGKDRALGFLVGQAMKETKGKANPQMLNKMFLEELNK